MSNPANDLVLAYLNRAVALHEQGYVDRDDLDTAMRLGCGLPAGPLRQLDRVGLDRSITLMETAGIVPAALLRTLAAQGRGFHRDDEPADAEVTTRSDIVPRIGVVGSGVMARGIAQAVIAEGLSAVLVVRAPDRAEAAVRAITVALDRQVQRGRIAVSARDAALNRLATTTRIADLGDCDVVIEAVAEEMDAKRVVFTQLGRLCRSDALLATTTSSLPVHACAEASGRLEDVVGMHFFNPAPAMRLIEVVRTPATSDAATQAACRLAVRLGKVPVVCADRAGFIVNYLLFGYLNDAIGLAERGIVTVEELDEQICRLYGYPMGPFALLDTVGLDVSLAILRRLHDAFGEPHFAVRRPLVELVGASRLGRKTGSGFRSWVSAPAVVT